MIEIKEDKGIIVAGFSEEDRLNSLISDSIKESLLSHYKKPNTKMILDLEGIKFIDSSGFGVFLSVMKAANNNYGEFKICHVAPDVKELFQVLQLHTILDIYDSLDECIASFN